MKWNWMFDEAMRLYVGKIGEPTNQSSWILYSCSTLELRMGMSSNKNSQDKSFQLGGHSWSRFWFGAQFVFFHFTSTRFKMSAVMLMKLELPKVSKSVLSFFPCLVTIMSPCVLFRGKFDARLRGVFFCFHCKGPLTMNGLSNGKSSGAWANESYLKVSGDGVYKAVKEGHVLLTALLGKGLMRIRTLNHWSTTFDTVSHGQQNHRADLKPWTKPWKVFWNGPNSEAWWASFTGTYTRASRRRAKTSFQRPAGSRTGMRIWLAQIWAPSSVRSHSPLEAHVCLEEGKWEKIVKNIYIYIYI